MPIRLSDLKADVRSVSFDYGGNVVNIQYTPSAITPIFQSKVNKIDKRDSMNMIDPLFTVLVGWDVLGDDDKPIEITAQTLGSLPITFLVGIMQVVFEDIKPRMAEEKKSSGGGSSTATCRRRKKKQ